MLILAQLGSNLGPNRRLKKGTSARFSRTSTFSKSTLGPFWAPRPSGTPKLSIFDRFLIDFLSLLNRFFDRSLIDFWVVGWMMVGLVCRPRLNKNKPTYRRRARRWPWCTYTHSNISSQNGWLVRFSLAHWPLNQAQWRNCRRPVDNINKNTDTNTNTTTKIS